MPMTKCPTCGSDVSTEAASCPKCGHQFKSAGAFSMKDPVHAGCVIFFVLLGLFLVLVLSSQGRTPQVAKHGETKALAESTPAAESTSPPLSPTPESSTTAAAAAAASAFVTREGVHPVPGANQFTEEKTVEADRRKQAIEEERQFREATRENDSAYLSVRGTVKAYEKGVSITVVEADGHERTVKIAPKAAVYDGLAAGDNVIVRIPFGKPVDGRTTHHIERQKPSKAPPQSEFTQGAVAR